jgi:hypothetical protein
MAHSRSISRRAARPSPRREDGICTAHSIECNELSGRGHADTESQIPWEKARFAKSGFSTY